MIIQERFDILRGYFDGGGYHSGGGHTVSLDDILHKMEFDDINDFSNWYKSLIPKEIVEGKKEWCSGDCCQSILKQLLKK